MKTFKLDGLDIYITNVDSVESATIIARTCGYGVTESNLIEVSRIPSDVKVYSRLDRPRFEPGAKFAIDHMLDY